MRELRSRKAEYEQHFAQSNILQYLLFEFSLNLLSLLICSWFAVKI